MIDLRGALRRAAIEVSRYYRLRGAVDHYDTLARAGVPLSCGDHRHYFMVWQASRVLDSRPRGLPHAEPRPPVASR